ncbi:hypothetical protein ACG93R_02105 [Acinetobacter guillouiae]|uniref:hypothetical protein n=1 Tax=Acinetobacter guillouiae TaxID=106649 RepID=UPI003AF75801
MGIGSSPTVGSTCDTCLQKFTIHFRRIEDSIYDGSYGFDWYRPEFFRKMTYYQGISAAKERTRVALVQGTLDALKSTYTNGQKTRINPHDMEYIPAWLAIYSNEWLNANNFKVNDSYITLNLELIPIEADENFKLQNDGTVIIFKSSNPNIIIEPSEINIADFSYSQKKTRNSETLENNIENEFYYLMSNIVRIQCKSMLQNHEEILVYAKKNGNEKIVGQLMIYHNSVIPTMNIQMIHLKTKGIPFKPLDDYKDFLKYRAFNQALIHVDFNDDIIFNVGAIKVNSKNTSLEDSLERLKANIKSNLLDDVNNIYQHYFKKVKTDNYVFMTNINLGSPAGVADEDNKRVIMFKKSETNFNQILAHELAHRYGLDHLFDPQKTIAGAKSFQFRQGTTSNFLDYDHKDKNDTNEEILANPNLSLSYFFKYQWDLLRKKVK